jgi:hypothetical protein
LFYYTGTSAGFDDGAQHSELLGFWTFWAMDKVQKHNNSEYIGSHRTNSDMGFTAAFHTIFKKLAGSIPDEVNFKFT